MGEESNVRIERALRELLDAADEAEEAASVLDHELTDSERVSIERAVRGLRRVSRAVSERLARFAQFDAAAKIARR